MLRDLLAHVRDEARQFGASARIGGVDETGQGQVGRRFAFQALLKPPVPPASIASIIRAGDSR